MTAALALPGIAMGTTVLDPGDFPVIYKNLSYEEDNLMAVDADYINLGIPINAKNDLLVALEYETMSGASPIFYTPGPGDEIIEVTSGASITDERTAVSFNFRHLTDSGMLSVTPASSDENDYESFSVTTEYQWDRNNNNTTYSVGAGYADDNVTATGQDLDEDKEGTSMFFGVTQVLDAHSLLQLNLSLAEESGYLSDPYKLVLVDTAIVSDNRPEDRGQTAFLVRYINYIEDDASLHLAYRYFDDDWGIKGHTLETTWNQELSNNWLVSYNFRYYQQDKAEFYAPFFSTPRSDGIYSSDYRLASYGSVLVGFKLEKTFTSNTSLEVNIEYYTRRGDLKISGDFSTDPEPLTSTMVTFGISHTF
ncbi:MAG: DUF3570 domain-containing protein [Gammaproteobacteria bacterium]|nr:DUF3570 domain-containing protein [Gammaproteobacteria bacterium]